MRKIGKRTIGKMLALVLICSSLVSCGNKETKEQPTVDMHELKNELLASDTTLPEMKTVTSEDENAELNFTSLSDMDYSLVDSYFYSYAEGGDVQEVAVIALKEEGDAAEAMESLHDHVENRLGTLKEYSPDKVELAEDAVITNEGRYVVFIIAEKSGMIQNTFKESITE